MIILFFRTTLIVAIKTRTFVIKINIFAIEIRQPILVLLLVCKNILNIAITTKTIIIIFEIFLFFNLRKSFVE